MIDEVIASENVPTGYPVKVLSDNERLEIYVDGHSRQLVIETWRHSGSDTTALEVVDPFDGTVLLHREFKISK